MSMRSVQLWVVVLVTIAGLTLLSCDGFLEDVSPTDALPVEEGFQSAEDLEVFLRGAYSNLVSGAGDNLMIIIADLSTEDLTAPVSCGTGLQSDAFDIHEITPDNRFLDDMWFAAYRTINQANVLVTEAARLLENQDIPDTTANRIEGESRFLRAVTYFQLVRLFANPFNGDDAPSVPMPLSGATNADQLEFLPRSTIAEVYAQISTDLDIAADLLLNTEIRDGRASRLAAKAILAGVEFQQGNYQAALDHAEDVIASNRFALVTPPERFFEEENTEEVIWSLIRDPGEDDVLNEYTQGQACGYVVFVGDLYARTFGRIVSAEQKNEVSMNGWTVSDLRFTRLTNADTAGGDWRSMKYLREADQPVMRYAEILLMHAECLARNGDLGEAVDYLNMIRKRSLVVADGSGNPVPFQTDDENPVLFKPGDLTQEELIEALILERQVELLLEGNRFHDLMRLGRDINSIPANSCRLRWPIPQAELDANDNISQDYPGEC